MKLKHTVYVFLIGFVLYWAAAILVWIYQPNSKNIVIPGYALMLIGIVLFVIKLTMHPKLKEWMDN